MLAMILIFLLDFAITFSFISKLVSNQTQVDLFIAQMGLIISWVAWPEINK